MIIRILENALIAKTNEVMQNGKQDSFENIDIPDIEPYSIDKQTAYRLIIAQGFSHYTNYNAEKFRSSFVNHQGKEEIRVIVNDILFSKNSCIEEKWTEAKIGKRCKKSQLFASEIDEEFLSRIATKESIGSDTSYNINSTEPLDISDGRVAVPFTTILAQQELLENSNEVVAPPIIGCLSLMRRGAC
ncbi:13260_t:CDS:2 [Funneliformis caledonium]|uniref:13260_t:CDS:1 n=1 Tax=Funneliformis caledonium TaxID=1117310 RepID=A0A9N8W399_9GLOM|nr:13260_t:CDS:2 [Funneliformis caledonium]